MKTRPNGWRGITGARLAAYVQIIGPTKSVYWWQGEIEGARELQLVIKTTSDRLGELETCIKDNHSYDIPEITFTEISGGIREYLDWISAERQRDVHSAHIKQRHELAAQQHDEHHPPRPVARLAGATVFSETAVMKPSIPADAVASREPAGHGAASNRIQNERAQSWPPPVFPRAWGGPPAEGPCAPPLTGYSDIQLRH